MTGEVVEPRVKVDKASRVAVVCETGREGGG